MWRSHKHRQAHSPDPGITGRSQSGFNPTRLGYLLIGFWAVVGAIATASNWQRIQPLELRVQTLFLELRGPVSPPQDVVILAMDDDSFVQAREFYNSDPKKYANLESLKVWPWKRAAYAEVIEKLIQAGAKVVAVDVLFANPSSYGQADDQRLAQVLQRYPDQVVLAAEYTSSFTTAGKKDDLVTPELAFPDLSLNMGLINYQPEVDEKIHRLAERYQLAFLKELGAETKIPSFYQATLNAAQVTTPPIQGTHIFYYGPQYTFPRKSFWEVMHPTNWQVYLREQTFKDKIVLIGPTALELQDFQPTPFGTIAGVEIHANSLATIMEGRAIAEAFPNPLSRGLLVLLGVLGTGVILNFIPRRTVGRLFWAVGIALSWGIVSYASFTYGRLIIPTAVPMLSIFLGGVSYLAIGAISDQFEQRRLRRTLERYVAAPIVQEILLNHSGDFQALLKGRKIKAAILFSDVRGFTTLSYKLEPEKLVEQLNTYFNVMVEEILDAGGTVDKFIGDAVMAEFGSPITNGEKADAMNSIKAALGMRRALSKLRQQWQQDGEVLFFNGIGINYGEVIAGDIGSERRREYAVIGDAVNVASRVEGMTKNFWTDILITESLYRIVQDEVEVVDVGEHGLKGREEGLVHLYSLIGLKGEDQNLYKQVCEDLRLHLKGAEEPPIKL